MTDNEIYEALHNAGESVDYEKVYLWHWVRDEPIIIRFRDVVDLINRQKAEIERLESEMDEQYEIAEGNIRAEIASCGTSCHWCEDRVKAEAIKEFAERLKAGIRTFPKLDFGGCFYYTIGTEAIDNLVKEMVGEDK